MDLSQAKPLSNLSTWDCIHQRNTPPKERSTGNNSSYLYVLALIHDSNDNSIHSNNGCSDWLKAKCWLNVFSMSIYDIPGKCVLKWQDCSARVGCEMSTSKAFIFPAEMHSIPLIFSIPAMILQPKYVSLGCRPVIDSGCGIACAMRVFFERGKICGHLLW